MKSYFISFFILVLCVNIKAQDTLQLNKKKRGNWQMQLTYSYCYNNRNTWLHLNNSNLTENEVLTYIDTAIIPCYTKRTAIQIIGNISPYFAMQLGLNYGRTGYMAAPIPLTNSYNGQQYAEIAYIPEPRTSITFGTKINITIRKFVTLGLLSGIEINPNSRYYDTDFYYLKDETNGIWGINPTKKIDGNTLIIHGGHGIGFIQYNLGLITQINITKRIYTVFGYDYFSQFKKGQIEKRISYTQKFSYYSRSYTHSFSIGIGLRFY